MNTLTKEHPIMTFAEVYAVKRLSGEYSPVLYEGGYTTFLPSIDKALDEVDKEFIIEALAAFGVSRIEISGYVHGKKPKYIVTDVKFDDKYLAVPHAKNVAGYLKQRFVQHKIMSTKSMAKMKKYSPAEFRPLDEFIMDDGSRLITYYYRAEHK